MSYRINLDDEWWTPAHVQKHLHLKTKRAAVVWMRRQKVKKANRLTRKEWVDAVLLKRRKAA